MSVRFGVVESHLGGVQVVVGDDKVPCNTTVRRGRGRLTAWRRLASTTINCRWTTSLMIRDHGVVAVAAINNHSITG